MKKFLILFFLVSTSLKLFAQMPPPPPLQPGEKWTNLWSVSYDYQSNGSIRYLVQDPFDHENWGSILMAQHDSNTAAGVGRYIYDAFSDDNGALWFSDVLNTTSSFGFPCITLSSGIPVIAFHQSGAVGTLVYKDLVFGGFTFSQVGSIPPISGANQPIWPHISGTSNGNLVVAASPNDGAAFIGNRTTFSANSWSNYTEMVSINGPSGNFDVASGPNGKAAIVGSDYTNLSALSWFESNNNGVSFNSGNLIMNFINAEGDMLYANVVGGYQSVYDESGNIHVIFAAYNFNKKAIFPNPNTTAFVKPRIYHWSSLTNNFTQIAGRNNIAGLTDTITQSTTVPVGQPTITRTASGKLVCAFTTYLRGNTQVVENGDVVNAGEIFYSASDDNGVTWSSPLNITNTPNIEEKHPSFSPNSSTDIVGLFYLRDMKAGNWVTVSGWGKAPVYGIFNLLNFNSPPLAPILTSPLNNSNYVSITPLLDWQNTFSATSYTVQLSSSPSFSSFIVNQNTTVSEFNVPASALNYDSVYYWRIAATNNFGNGAWSAVWNFRTTTFLPPSPALLAPVNGAIEISLTPTFSWMAAPDAVSYNLQVSIDSNFIMSPVFTQLEINALQYQLPASILSINNTYFWRVNSNNSNGTGPWSGVYRFRTISIPAAPVLISPANGSTGIPLAILLNWNDVSNAQRYRLQLSADSNFAVMLVNDSGLTVSQYPVPSTLLNFNTKYFWKVNAINSAGNGPFSETWNFRTTNSLPPPAPVLLSPANGSSNVMLTPTLDWGNSPGAITYKVQVSIDVNFSILIVDESELPSSQYTIPPPILTTNSLYFWRAASVNDAGASPWSAEWNFRTTTVGVNLISEHIPTEYGLFNNYPNPFNPATRIKFDLPESGITSLNVFDINGREVTQLINERLNAGRYELEFSADKYNLSSGIYFYKLISGKFIETKQMVLIK